MKSPAEESKPNKIHFQLIATAGVYSFFKKGRTIIWKLRNSRLPIFSDLNAREQQAKSEDEDSKLSLTEIAN